MGKQSGRYKPGARVGLSRKRNRDLKAQGFNRGCRHVLYVVATVCKVEELRGIYKILMEKGPTRVEEWPTPTRDESGAITWSELLEVGGFIKTPEEQADGLWAGGP